MKTKKYHLTLSGWWIRGIAHIGIYQALQEQWYQIQSISGTSAGALVGLFIAAGKTAREMEEIVTNLSKFHIIQWIFSQQSLFTTKTIQRIIEKHIPYHTIEELPIPLTVCATDIDTWEAVYYTKGLLSKIIPASCAVPGISQPVVYEWRRLVDGWVGDNFPIPHHISNPIIGCHVNPLSQRRWRWTQVLMTRALKLLISRDISKQKKKM